MKKLNEFEMQCVLEMLAAYISHGSMYGLPDAEERRVVSRLRRFVLTHQDVTPKLRRVFNAARKA